MARRERTVSSGINLGIGLLIFAVGMLGIASLGLLPGLPNPFETDTVDRNRPVLLQSLEDVSEYTAAAGNFEVIVDTEQDARYLPDFVKGERTVLSAVGDVEATVDFTGIGEGAVVVEGDRVTITVPEPAEVIPMMKPVVAPIATAAILWRRRMTKSSRSSIS